MLAVKQQKQWKAQHRKKQKMILGRDNHNTHTKIRRKKHPQSKPKHQIIIPQLNLWIEVQT